MIAEFISKYMGNYVDDDVIERVKEWCFESDKNLNKCIEALNWFGEYEAIYQLKLEAAKY